VQKRGSRDPSSHSSVAPREDVIESTHNLTRTRTRVFMRLRPTDAKPQTTNTPDTQTAPVPLSQSAWLLKPSSKQRKNGIPDGAKLPIGPFPGNNHKLNTRPKIRLWRGTATSQLDSRGFAPSWTMLGRREISRVWHLRWRGSTRV